MGMNHISRKYSHTYLQSLSAGKLKRRANIICSNIFKLCILEYDQLKIRTVHKAIKVALYEVWTSVNNNLIANELCLRTINLNSCI